MQILDILRDKGNTIISVAPETKIQAAIRKLCENRIGSLLVLDENGGPVGIITERDILLEVNDNAMILDDRQVSEVMTSNLICAKPDDSVDYALGVMTENRIRHLPIVNEGQVIALISVGDLIKSLKKLTESENQYLRDYISQGG